METPDGLQGVDVVILAGGRGTRLQSLPGDLPKPLRPVHGRPFLSYLLDQVRAAGARKVILALGYKPEAFLDFLRDEASPTFVLEMAVEASPMGTGGALRAALSRLSTDTVLVLNGDSYADADPAPLAAAHRRRKARATILLGSVEDASRYGRVEIDAEGAVVRFAEKSAPGAGLINAGVYVLERSVIRDIPADRPVSLERETFPSLIGKGFYGEPGTFAFLDIGTPETYAASAAFFQKPGAR